MKFLKNNLKVIIVFIICVILASSIGGTTAFASYNYFANQVSYITPSGQKLNVESALNELYSKKNNIDVPYIENIWSSSALSVDYTYTVAKDGIYLVSISGSNKNNSIGNITTNAQEKVNNKIINTYGVGSTYSVLKVINAKANDTIKIEGYTTYSSSNSFIVKLNNINISEITHSNITNDSTAKCEYTATDNNEKVLVVSIATATNRSNSITYNSNYLATSLRNNNDYIDYSILKKDTTVTTTAYGYNWGGGVTYILK